jgi:hypothetical protein
MKTLVRLTTALANKALGTVDAGACTAYQGCCCAPSSGGITYATTCWGTCVQQSCNPNYSVYGLSCD